MNGERPLWRRVLVPACLGLVAVNAVALAVWTGPRELRRGAAAPRAEQARAEVERLRVLVVGLRERKDLMRANAADRERLYALAGSERRELAPVHEAVQSMARSVGLRLGSRTVSHEDIKGTPLERVTFRMPLAGSYDQLVGFLREVEISPRFLVVERVSMQGVQAAPGNANLQVELSTIMKSPPQDAGAGGGDGR